MKRSHMFVRERIGLPRTQICAATCGALALVFVAFAPAPSAYAACGNEAIRESQGAFAKALPDCRAYELVSPGSKPFLFFFGDNYTTGAHASTTGNRFAYLSQAPAENAQVSGTSYLSIRGEDGWSTQPAEAQDSPGAVFGKCEQELDFSPDLSKSVLKDGWSSGSYCQSADEELAPGAPAGYSNLFLREDATSGPYRLVNLTPETAVPGNALFAAASTDFSHIVFTDAAQLTPDAPEGASLYEWVGGTVHLLTYLPGATPTTGAIASYGSEPFKSFAQVEHAVSADGERVFFTSQNNLYLRQNAAQPQSAVDGEGHCTEPAKACTIQIDAADEGAEGPSGGGEFYDAAADGSKVFFADQNKLTGDSTAQPGAPDLYEYDLQTGQLTDLTVDNAEPAHVSNYISASEDGSYLYFVALGAITGEEENEHHEKAEAGARNLYLRHAGATTFIATLSGNDVGFGRDRASANGKFFVFTSIEPLTGFSTEPGPSQIFLYDAAANRLSCASCGPEGTPPGESTVLPFPQEPLFLGETESSVYLQRSVIDDGRVFFTTYNALVPQDIDNNQDVYEYENGQVRLISSGTDPDGSYFYDADPSGSNVFFVTGQGLLRSDTNNAASLYDAREGGGFSEPPPSPPCENEGCRGVTPPAPGASTAGTETFTGREEGHNHPGKPPHHHKKHHAKKHHRAHKRAANTNRRAGR